MEKQTFSVEETAIWLGIGLNTAYGMVKDGLLPHVKIGRQIRISIRALEAWFQEQSQNSISQNK